MVPCICVAVNFLFQLIFVFPLFLGMVMHANEFETKEKQKLTEIKNKLQHMHNIIKRWEEVSIAAANKYMEC